MSAFGLTGLTKIPGAVYKVEQSSFATYDKTYSGVIGGSGIVFTQGETAEEYPNVVLLSMEVKETGTQCDHLEITLHFEGKDSAFASSDTVQDISVDFTTSQEPIESHPDFCDNIGGTPEHPKHGAFFEKTGEFLGFPVVDPDEPDKLPSRFAGLRSYLMPQETYTSSTVDYGYPDPAEIGSIGMVIEPGIPLPSLSGTRSWLSTGIRVQNIANVYFRAQRTGMLSGPRNWIPEVYGGAA